MSTTDSIRRLAVFAVLFGGAVGVLAWLAGGLVGRSPVGDGPQESSAHVGGVAPVGPNVGVGESIEGRVSHEGVRVIDGKACNYRAWTASWKKATPKPSSDPEIGVQDLDAPHVTLFPEPQTSSAPPIVEGAPGTTRITAKAGTLQFQKDVRTQGRLTGDVDIRRFDPQGGDMALRTQTLDVSMDSRGGVEKRHAQTVDPVAIDGGRAHVQGTGLDADLAGAEMRATILANVKGRFDAPPGAITQAGGSPAAASLPTDVTCSGACEIVSLDAKPRVSERRWKATFHDDVHVTQGDDKLDCDLLEIEFRMGDAKSTGDLPPQHVVATGHVHVNGRTQTRTFEVTCDKATHGRTGNVGDEIDVVTFEGSPFFKLLGPLAQAGDGKPKDPKKPAAADGRLEIRCDAPVVMSTRRSGRLPTSPYRTNAVFEKNVVVKQWDDEKIDAPTAELRAPKATLYGTRLPDGALQPDSLTSEGGVDIRRGEITTHSSAATWIRVETNSIDRFMLVGDPTVTCNGIRALNVFGKPAASPHSVVVLQSADNVTIDVYKDLPPVPKERPRPFAIITAGPRAVLVQSQDGHEIARATGDQIQATISKARRLEHAEATGNAHVWSLGREDRQADVYGARIVLDELVAAPGAPADAPPQAQAVALGDEAAPAIAVLREKNDARHEIHADMLRYDQNGAVVTAQGHVDAALDGKGRERPGVLEGAVKIQAVEAVFDLVPDAEAVPNGPRLKRVRANGGVVVDAKTHRILAREITYEEASGLVEAKGVDMDHPARIIDLTDSERYTSFLNSALIRAYLDVSGDPAKRGEVIRATCPGGGTIVRYFDPPGVDGKPVPGKTPHRMRFDCKGPIESTRTEATAVGDVVAYMESLAPSGEWTIRDGTIYCDRAHLTFDVDAPGQAKDRLRTVQCTGTTGPDGKQVLVEMEGDAGYRAYADQVDIDCAQGTLHVSTTSPKLVYVREISSNGRQFLCDSGTYHYATHEWTDLFGYRLTEQR